MKWTVHGHITIISWTLFGLTDQQSHKTLSGSGAYSLSQHNIIGSEAFDGRPYIIVRKVRVGISRRRRRNAIVMVSVAVIALIVGALVAVFALAPLLLERNHAMANAEALLESRSPLVAPTKPEDGVSTTSATGGPAITPVP